MQEGGASEREKDGENVRGMWGGGSNLGKEVGGHDEPDGVIGERLKGRHEVQSLGQKYEGLGHPGAGAHRQGFDDQSCKSVTPSLFCSLFSFLLPPTPRPQNYYSSCTLLEYRAAPLDHLRVRLQFLRHTSTGTSQIAADFFL